MSDPPAPAPLLLLLGPPVWQGGGAPMPWPAERRLQLLAWLAHHDEWVGRDRVAALLWPGHERAAAQRNLRKQLYRLHELSGLPPVQERGRMLRWEVATDVRRFEAALHSGDVAAAVALWRDVPWRGLDADAAAGEGGLAEWLALERTRLTRLWREAVLALAQRDPLQAGDCAQRLLRADPLDERGLQLLMSTALREGRRAEAVAAFGRFAHALRQELQLEPSAASWALLREAGATEDAGEDAGEGAPAPGAASAAPATTEPGFVGRVAEQRGLDAALAQPGCRWLTVVGAGGSGKTRLVRERFDAGLALHRPWRVWVDLGDVDDRAQALRRVAAACGTEPRAERDALRHIGQALAARSGLLVLDNLEQLPLAALALAEVLAGCPGIQVVATSRVRLAVPGEHLLALGGLPWPQPEDIGRALAFDAVTLFVRHAQRHNVGFDATVQAGAVARLCAWVEGNPLALLLAAPWVRHLSVEALLSQLQRGATGLLGDASAGGPARQHSIEASFEHSWRLLTPAERQALARLAVFRGSFTLEAAQEVAAAPLPVLVALMDKSLLQGADGGARVDAPRLSLHPLVAELAGRSGGPHNADAAEAAHCICFMRWMARLPPATRMAERDAYLRVAAAEYANLHVAWFQALQRRDLQALEWATAGWTVLSWAAGQMHRGLEGLREAARALPEGSLAQARVRTAQSWLCVNLGDLPSALEAGRSALVRLRRGEDVEALVRCRQVLSGALSRLGRHAAAQRLQQSLLRHCLAEGRHQQAANMLHELALIDQRIGRVDSALSRNSQALELLARSGLYSDLIEIFQGRLQRLCGQPRAAIATLEQLLRRRSAAMPLQLRSEASITLALAHLEAGQPARAEELDAQARELDADGESGHWSAVLGVCSARVALALGHAHDGHQRLRAAAARLVGQDWPPVEQELACETAAWLQATGRAAAAQDLLAGLLGQELRDADTQARALRLHGRRRVRKGFAREELMALVRAALAADPAAP